jgi:hypothetical protein
MNSLCAGGLRGDARRDQVTLLPRKFLARANDTAGRLCLVGGDVGYQLIHF